MAGGDATAGFRSLPGCSRNRGAVVVASPPGFTPSILSFFPFIATSAGREDGIGDWNGRQSPIHPKYLKHIRGAQLRKIPQLKVLPPIAREKCSTPFLSKSGDRTRRWDVSAPGSTQTPRIGGQIPMLGTSLRAVDRHRVDIRAGDIQVVEQVRPSTVAADCFFLRDQH
jgi:hypothetical protein